MVRRIVWGFLAVAGVLMPGPAGAAELHSITATPTTQRLEVAAGAAVSGSVKIMNSGATDYEFTVYTDPFSVSGEDYKQSYVLQPKMVDASKWFQLRQTNFQLKAGQELAVPYEVRVPVGAGPGGYYAVLFAETSAAGPGNIKSKKRVGVIFYLTVSGAVQRDGNVESFNVPWLHVAPPMEMALRMKNGGNVHFDAETQVEVKDIFGNRKVVLEADKVVLPQTVRRIPLEWSKAPGFGLFRVEGTVKYAGNTERLPVRYTLMLSATAFVVMFLIMLALVTYAFMSRGRRSNVTRRR